MGKIIDKLLRNPVTFEVTSIFVYLFYCLVYAIAAVPSALLIRWGTRFLGGHILLFLLFVCICCASFYIFLIASAIVVGFAERLLTLGLKPGAYEIGSPEFFQWLVYSGLHLWSVNIILPFLRGNNWIKIYLRISGAKIGKEVFINTKHVYDAYLLEIEDNVIVGGEVFLNCHLFENGCLILGRIKLGEGTMIGAKAYLPPGSHTGKNSKVGINTYFRLNTNVQDGESMITLPGINLRTAVKLMKDKK